MSGEATRSWSWRQAFARSDLHSTTKHVLHTLHMFMNALGESCYPSISDLQEYSGLDKKTILTHLKKAREAGWIVVSQHGYRGQKWKRNEYTARWPERDLEAPCPPDGEQLKPQKGGGRVPPPSTEKVVEMVPEGGGTGSTKVVEEIHQDKNNPVNNPLNKGARERGLSPVGTQEAQSIEQGAGDVEGGGRTPKQVERMFWKLVKDWPGLDGMPKKRALSFFEALSEADQDAALEHRDTWIGLLRSQHKSHTPAPSTYCAERLWTEIPEGFGEDGAEKTSSAAKAFGKGWGVVRFADLMRAPYGPPQKLTRAEEALCASGRYDRESFMRPKLAKFGWPNVMLWQGRALRHHKGVSVPAGLAPLLDLFGKVAVRSDLWRAWQELHGERGWPWIDGDLGRVEWVYFPEPPDPIDSYPSLQEAVRAAMTRFETEHATITQKDAAE